MTKNLKHLLLALVIVSITAFGAHAQTATPTPTVTPTARVEAPTGYDDSSPIGQANAADVSATFSVATGAKAYRIGDLIRLVKIPKGAIVTNWYVYWPDLDSSTSLTVNLGTSDDEDQFLSNSTLPRAAGPSKGSFNPTGNVVGSLPTSAYLTDDYLQVRVTASANPTPPAGGTISGWITYNMRGEAF